MAIEFHDTQSFGTHNKWLTSPYCLAITRRYPLIEWWLGYLPFAETRRCIVTCLTYSVLLRRSKYPRVDSCHLVQPYIVKYQLYKFISWPDGVVGYHVSLTPIRSWDRAPVWSSFCFCTSQVSLERKQVILFFSLLDRTTLKSPRTPNLGLVWPSLHLSQHTMTFQLGIFHMRGLILCLYHFLKADVA